MNNSDLDLLLWPVGWVRSEITSRAQSPKMEHEGAPDAWIEIEPRFAPALDTLEEGQEIWIFTWLHQSERRLLQVHPRGDMNRALRGVFSTRSPDRPNPIGMHRVRILARKAHYGLHVYPLEALNGTPVVDIKPIARQRIQGSAEQEEVGWGPHVPVHAAQNMRRLLERAWSMGLLAGVHGNVSVRQAGHVLITTRGAAKGNLVPGDLTALEQSTGKRLSPGRPSSEAPVHLALYDTHEAIGAVVHTHPPHILALSLAVDPESFLDLPLYEAAQWRDKLARIPELAPGSEALAEAVAQAAAPGMDACPAALLAKHGLVCWGETLAEALNVTESLEVLARIQLLALSGASGPARS